MNGASDMPGNLGALQRPLTLAALALLAVIALRAGAASSDYMQEFGAYRVHYSAIPSEQLLPDVARHYGIERSPHAGFVNIAVQQKASGETAAPVRAAVGGSARSLEGQRVPISFHEIVEEGAVYYIGEFPTSPPDTYRFEIRITPESATTAPFTVRFSQDFVAD